MSTYTRPALQIDKSNLDRAGEEVLAAMKADGWYVRERRGVRPALWQRVGPGLRFIAAKPTRVAVWIMKHYRCDGVRDAVVFALASRILSRVREGQSTGLLLAIDDQTAGLL
jgi:hypothetical protein